MKQFQKTIFPILGLILLTACGSFSALRTSQEQSGTHSSAETDLAAMFLTDQAKLQTSVATETATFTPLPSATRIPSATFTPTSTDTPTATQIILPTYTKVVVSPVITYGGNCGASLNSSFEAQVISLINQQRASSGLPGLSSSGALSNAARNHSLDMACNNFMSHTGSNGSDFGSRLSLAGFSYSSAAENIAAGQSSPADVVSAWMGSDGHKANILNASFTYIGVGYAYSSGSTYNYYWTADFGRP
jgi:uncharacterized protein YkwD